MEFFVFYFIEECIIGGEYFVVFLFLCIVDISDFINGFLGVFFDIVEGRDVV